MISSGPVGSRPARGVGMSEALPLRCSRAMPSTRTFPMASGKPLYPIATSETRESDSTAGRAGLTSFSDVVVTLASQRTPYSRVGLGDSRQADRQERRQHQGHDDGNDRAGPAHERATSRADGQELAAAHPERPQTRVVR